MGFGYLRLEPRFSRLPIGGPHQTGQVDALQSFREAVHLRVLLDRLSRREMPHAYS